MEEDVGQSLLLNERGFKERAETAEREWTAEEKGINSTEEDAIACSTCSTFKGSF